MFNKRIREKINSWPAFVDLFSNLVIILIFLLIVFVFLWTTTSVFNKNTGAKRVAELTKIQQEQAEQIEQMTADKQTAEQLLVAARDALLNQEAKIENQQIQQKNLASAYENQIALLTSHQEQLAQQMAEQRQQMTTQQEELMQQIAALSEQLRLANDEKKALSEQGAADRKDILDQANSELDELSVYIHQLEAALEESEKAAAAKEVEYAEMSERLNKALAEKIAELNALSQYQSEFYKAIKIALGDRTSIQPDGDRFIVSSDILFPSGSFKVSDNGKTQLKLLANVIKDFENKIPTDIDWIIRVDGHTDKKDVIPGTAGYKNNTELSLLRATAVVNELVKNGVSKRRLVPSGFGALHPRALGSDKKSLQQNRRIELQLTNK